MLFLSVWFFIGIAAMVCDINEDKADGAISDQAFDIFQRKFEGYGNWVHWLYKALYLPGFLVVYGLAKLATYVHKLMKTDI